MCTCTESGTGRAGGRRAGRARGRRFAELDGAGRANAVGDTEPPRGPRAHSARPRVGPVQCVHVGAPVVATTSAGLSHAHARARACAHGHLWPSSRHPCPPAPRAPRPRPRRRASSWRAPYRGGPSPCPNDDETLPRGDHWTLLNASYSDPPPAWPRACSAITLQCTCPS